MTTNWILLGATKAKAIKEMRVVIVLCFLLLCFVCSYAVMLVLLLMCLYCEQLKRDCDECDEHSQALRSWDVDYYIIIINYRNLLLRVIFVDKKEKNEKIHSTFLYTT
jgi:hypothetical protein